MWITTKSIVNEIKKNQEDLSEKLEILVMEQKENSSTLQNQIKAISSRIETLEKKGMDESKITRKQLETLINGLEELKQLIRETKGQICNVVSEQTQKCIGNVSTAVEKEAEAIWGQISNSTDRVCGTVKTQTDKIEEIKRVKEKSDTDRKQCITILMDTISKKIEQLEKEISDKSNNVVIETRKCNDDIAREIESLGDTIQSVSSVAESKDAVISDNIETMNYAMQEIMQNLMSLDEGNRLIIAKLLVRDMEI